MLIYLQRCYKHTNKDAKLKRTISQRLSRDPRKKGKMSSSENASKAPDFERVWRNEQRFKE